MRHHALQRAAPVVQNTADFEQQLVVRRDARALAIRVDFDQYGQRPSRRPRPGDDRLRALQRIRDDLQPAASFDEPKRAVFVLYELEELPMAEVAEIVGCPVQTAYSRLHAVRAVVEAAAARFRAKELGS